MQDKTAFIKLLMDRFFKTTVHFILCKHFNKGIMKKMSENTRHFQLPF